MKRVFILHGQGYVFSLGFNSLAKRLNRIGYATQHPWDDRDVISRIKTAYKEHYIIVIGHSLGANQIGYISDHFDRKLDLAIAYDPSRFSPLTKEDNLGIHFQTAPMFKRVVCYYNYGAWLFGGSLYRGDNVELVKISDFHLGITFNSDLNERTYKLIEAL